MNGLVSKVISCKVLIVSCLSLYVFSPLALGNVNIQLANLKQDMELVSRELAGLRTEVELLRRENAQLRVSVEQLTRRQNSASGANQGLTQQVDSRIQSLERRASKGEKEQAALQKTIDKKLKDLIAEMNRAITQVNKNSSSASTSSPKTFPRIILKRDSCTKSRGEKQSAALPKNTSPRSSGLSMPTKLVIRRRWVWARNCSFHNNSHVQTFVQIGKRLG